jgi:hypothetical protein
VFPNIQAPERREKALPVLTGQHISDANFRLQLLTNQTNVKPYQFRSGESEGYKEAVKTL